MNEKYRVIIDMPRHVSEKRPQMSLHDRAAQFAPFAALTGYDGRIAETARLTDSRIELSEDAKADIDFTLSALAERISVHPQINICYFVPDERKSGGKYVTEDAYLKRIDPIERAVVLTDGRRIAVDDILELNAK